MGGFIPYLDRWRSEQSALFQEQGIRDKAAMKNCDLEGTYSLPRNPSEGVKKLVSFMLALSGGVSLRNLRMRIFNGRGSYCRE